MPTDINAMIRTKHNVKRVLMSTFEMSVIIRATLTDGDAPPFGFFTSSIAEPYWNVRFYNPSQRQESPAPHRYDLVLFTRDMLVSVASGGPLGKPVICSSSVSNSAAASGALFFPVSTECTAAAYARETSS